MKMLLFAGLSILLVLTGCQPSQEEMKADIEEAEAALYGQGEDFKFDEAKAQTAVTAYDEYIMRYPEDTLSSTYLFKSAELKKALRDFDGAIADYKKLATDYPEADKAPQGVFLQGFIYENELGDTENARVHYEEFLEKYPDHELADDVEFSLTHLGKSADEIIREFEMKAQQADTLAQ